MKIGMIGLGKMGSQMTARLMKGNHECIVFDVNQESMKAEALKGATPSTSLKDLVGKLQKPRVVWVMLPEGEVTEKTVSDLGLLLSEGDVIIDGGNSYYKDDVRRFRELKQKDIHYVDVGTSGGIWGEENGYCLMVGAEKEIYQLLVPLFRTLAPGIGDIPKTPNREELVSNAEEGFLHCGPAGSGHFVKMIHNGIEYGMMESFAEGFDILKNANSTNLPEEHRYDLNLTNISEVWRRGSVISSWLLDLIAISLARNPTLSNFTGYVHDSGEGRWTIQAALEEAVPIQVLTAALFSRFRSRQVHTFAEKMLSAMRNQFGGHQEEAPKASSNV
jgi:6-phosphogluconate dehydrogenase